MTGMQKYERARRFLREPQEAARELAIRMEQLRRWKETAERTTAELGRERVQSQAASRVESCAVEIASLEEEIRAAREWSHALYERQEKVLRRVGEARLVEVLRLYYQCSFTWSETACHMGDPAAPHGSPRARGGDSVGGGKAGRRAGCPICGVRGLFRTLQTAEKSFFEKMS